MNLMMTTVAPADVPVGVASLDGVDLEQLAAQVQTPFHAYSANAIRRRIATLQSALAGLDAQVCYAVKANSHLAILQLMNEAGVGADIVSAGELQRSLRAGIPAGRIVFSGVGKSEEEIAEALLAGVSRFNVESHHELLALDRLARAHRVIAHAAVRVNPDVAAGAHEKISTGKAENKFGVSIAEARSWFASAFGLSHVRLDGLHVHIGSQILAIEPFREALLRVAAFWRELERDGHAVASIDVGGGLGVCYRQGRDRPIEAVMYVDVIREALAGFRGQIVLEPGRYLVAEAGVLLTRVVRIKHGEQRTFLVVDAAMNDLLRPALYDAWHDIVPVTAHPRQPVAYDIVGPVCETGDTFAVSREMPACKPGELLLIAATGAYGACMSSNYNSRPLAAEVMLDDGRYAVIRERQSFEQMIAGERPAREWKTA